MSWKFNLSSVFSPLVFGAAVGMSAPSTANATLTCTPGNIIGAGSCTETVTFGPSPVELNGAILTLDKWVSNAAAGFNQTLIDAKFPFSGIVSASGTVTNPLAQPQTISLSFSQSMQFSAGAARRRIS